MYVGQDKSLMPLEVPQMLGDDNHSAGLKSLSRRKFPIDALWMRLISSKTEHASHARIESICIFYLTHGPSGTIIQNMIEATVIEDDTKFQPPA
jgi:hypothetical protein